MRTRIHEWTDGAWRELFSYTNTEGVARAFCQATGCGVTPLDLAADLDAGTAFEATDPAGVRGLVCRDDSPHRPNVEVQA